MSRFHKLIGFLLLSTLIVGGTWAQSHRKPPNKRPPKKWDQSLLDVFFKDIRSEVGPGQPGTAPRMTASNNASGASGTGANTGNPSSGFAWSSITSTETLEDEIKKIVLDLEETVESPGRFKSGRHNDARRMFSVAAVMFAVIDEYDTDVRFKENAAGLRDATAKAGVNCKVNTDAAYNDARGKFEQLQEIIRGANVEVAVPEESLPYSEVAEYGPIMQRIEKGFLEIVQPGVSSTAEFRDKKEQLLHEAEMMAIFARVINDESYGYSSIDTFKEMADELQAQSLALAAAAKNNDLDAAQSAVGAIDQACTKCHADNR